MTAVLYHLSDGTIGVEVENSEWKSTITLRRLYEYKPKKIVRITALVCEAIKTQKVDKAIRLDIRRKDSKFDKLMSVSLNIRSRYFWNSHMNSCIWVSPENPLLFKVHGSNAKFSLTLFGNYVKKI